MTKRGSRIKIGVRQRTECVVSQDTRAMSRGNMSHLPTGKSEREKKISDRKELAKLAHRYHYENSKRYPRVRVERY